MYRYVRTVEVFDCAVDIRIFSRVLFLITNMFRVTFHRFSQIGVIRIKCCSFITCVHVTLEMHSYFLQLTLWLRGYMRQSYESISSIWNNNKRIENRGQQQTRRCLVCLIRSLFSLVGGGGGWWLP